MIAEISLLLFMSYSSYIISNLTDLLTSNIICTPTFDIYHHLIGGNLRFLFRYWWVPDSMLCITMLFITLLSYEDIEKFIFQLSILHMVRNLACISTTGYLSPRYIYNRCKAGIMNGCCSDLYISGHSMTATLLWCFIHDANINIILYMIISCIAFLAVVSNLLVGDHYTADVIVGVSLAMGIHW
jgi:membrane-associated phospholipid phosphatase